MGSLKKIFLVSIAGVLIIAGSTGCGKSKEKQEESNTAVVEKIKNLATDKDKKEFEDLMVVNMQLLTSKTGLTNEDVDNVFGQLPTEADSIFYLAIKPKSGNSKFGGTNKERVKKLVKNYINSLKDRLQSELGMPLSDNEEVSEEEKTRRAEIQKKIDMLNNMIIEESKGYIIFISSSDNAKVLKEIKKGL